jgi:uncharacterized membrane protein YkvA (DUF1232 family)
MNIQSLKLRAKLLKDNLVILYLAFKHENTPWYAKLLIGLVVSYALSPVDLIPDFIPILGYLDDLILIPAGIALAIKLIPDDVISECKQNKSNLTAIKIKGLYAGIVIALIWLLVIYFVLRTFIK